MPSPEMRSDLAPPLETLIRLHCSAVPDDAVGAGNQEAERSPKRHLATRTQVRQRLEEGQGGAF